MTATATDLPERAVDPYDWASILALIQRAFADMEGRIDPPSSMYALTASAIARQAETGEVWVIGTPPVACVFLTPTPPILHIGKLAVAKAMRGQGLARALVSLAEARAHRLGLCVLELQTRIELVENHVAFRRLGFVETARTAHPGYSRPTTLTFQRDVPTGPTAKTPTAQRSALPGPTGNGAA